ncbi:MAG: LuxR C-terminal-related transcriptional regulator [Actinomycetota bacterium]
MEARAPIFEISDWPLVGRDSEREQVRRALDRPDGVGVVIAGAAGLGKTRLACECVELARAGGFTTAQTVATTAAAGIPLGALAPLVSESEPAASGIDALRRAAGSIAALGSDRRLALLVDDAHLLDAASATVLHQVVTAGEVFAIVTVRTGEPTPAPVVCLWKDSGAERIDLQPLGRDDIEHLVSATLAGPVAGATVRDLAVLSEGNPLMLRELLLAAADCGALVSTDGVWWLAHPVTSTARLVDLVEERLSGLSAPERDAIDAVALAEPMGLAPLRDLCCDEVLERLERRGLLRVTVDGRRRFVWLAHPLYGEVVRQGMAALGRSRLQGILAGALDATGGRRREDVLRLATLRLDSGGTAEPAAWLQAARQAHAANDAALTERLARRALDQDGGAEAALVLADVLFDLGRHHEAREVLESMIGTVSGDEQRTRLVLMIGEALMWGLGRPDEAERLVVSTAETIVDAVCHDRLEFRRMSYEFYRGSAERALTVIRELIERLDGQVLVEGAVAVEPVLMLAGQLDATLALGERAYPLHLALSAEAVPAVPDMHLACRTQALADAGRLSEAESVGLAGYDHAVEDRYAWGPGWFAMALGRVYLRQGRLVEAGRRYAEAGSLFRDLGDGGRSFRRWCQAGRALAAAWRADRSELDEVLAQLDAGRPGLRVYDVEIDRARAWVPALRGELSQARDLLHEHASRARSIGAFPAAADALHDCVRLGDGTEVIEPLDEMACRVDGELTTAQAAHGHALAAGDGDALDEVSKGFEGLGALLLAAEAAAQAAVTYRRAGRSRLAERCALRVSALARRCDGAHTPALALAGPAGVLSAREREIASLAAKGYESKEIAAELSISVRTVHNHLQHVYQKLGVTSRRELAAALADDAVRAFT